MIDFDQSDTIPNSIISLLDKKRELIRNELILQTQRDIAGHQWDGEVVVKENYDETFEKIMELLCNEKVLGYHCTKLISPEEILKTGLKKLNPQEYKNWMKNFLITNVQDENAINIIDRFFAEYLKDDEFEHRGNMIWFYINKCLVHSSGSNDFFKYYGGEAIRRVTYPIRDVILPILIHTGTPTVVAFKFDFKELTDYHQDNIIDSLIRSKVFEKSNKYYKKMESEGYVNRDIQPQEVIQLIYDNNVSKLRNILSKKKRV